MYPRPGQDLLPAPLRPYVGHVALRAPVARKFELPATVALGQLGTDVWYGRSSAEVRELADEVIQAVNGLRPSDIADLPLFANSPALNDLDLSVRARNALGYAGLVESGRLRPTTIAAVCALPNFGTISLLDVLTASEDDKQQPSRQLTPAGSTATPSRAVDKAARALMRKRWANAVFISDPRVGSQLHALCPVGSTVREVAEALRSRDYEPGAAKKTAGAIRGFMRAMDALQRLSLESELKQIVEVVTERGAAQKAILARTGFGGEPPLTLEMTSTVIGVTKERVRQIEQRFKKQVSDISLWTPVLDRTLRQAANLAPISSSELGTALRAAGLTETSFAASSLVSAAQILNKETSFAISRGLVTPLGNWPSISKVRSAAARLVSHWGATTIADLEIELKEGGFEAESHFLVTALAGTNEFRWLDQERGWFWIRGSRNRLLNQVEKIMSVCGSIELGELRAGVGRPYRTSGFRPPREVLATLCVDTKQYLRQGDRISGGPALRDWQEVLGANERLLAQVLFDKGPVMRRDELERIVVTEHGLNRSSFYVYLTYSPIIERYAAGVFGLRGAPVSAAEIDAMIPVRVRHQVLQDFGWTDSGLLWSAYRISPAAESTGILGTPAAIQTAAAGRYELFAENRRPAGTLVIEQAMWGLSPFFRRWGVEAGDVIVIVLDLRTRQATVSVGTDELLLRYQSGE